MSELLEFVNKLVEDKTFNLDAVGRIAELREKVIALEKQLTFKENDNIKLKREIAVLNGKGESLEQQLKNWEDREEKLKVREAAATELEKVTAVANAKAEVYSTCMTQMLANRVVRENIVSNVPTSYVPPGSSYPTTLWNEERKVTSREEG